MGYTGLVALATAMFAAAPGPARAQLGGMGRSQANASEFLVQPVAHQVFQRDANGFGSIPIVFREAMKDAEVTSATATPMVGQPGIDRRFDNNSRQGLVDGKIVGVPTGGPYMVTISFRKKETPPQQVTVGPVFVGDLWVLAGQSNMEGVGDLIDVTPPHPKVTALGMDDKWVQAEEPLHWLVDSPDPVHSGDPKDRAERSAQQHKTRTKGAGLGLPFAVSMVEHTGVPVGLVITAHGGTSMQQWDPAKKGEGGNSLYGSMLRSVNLAGGKVKGVLWYQGESDSSPEGSKIYERVFADFIGAVRADLGQPELPFYFVQIGRFINGGDPKGWNAVQDAERRLPDRVPNTAVVATIDLELDDLIHVGTQGQKRVGQRLAKVALRELFGQVGATTPTFDRVTRGLNNTLVVKFRGVNLTDPQHAPIAARLGVGGRGGPAAFAAGAPGPGAGFRGGAGMANQASLGESSHLGLRPERHIAGFSIRKEDGSPVPLIFDASVGQARDTVVLKLAGAIPPGSFLWYGHGYDPYCNLTDRADMAVPVFGPIALDDFAEKPVAAAAAAPAPAPKPEPKKENDPVKLLIITGDQGHDWKATTESLKQILSKGDRIAVDVTTTPSKDLTDENLAKYDVLLLNYKDTPNGAPETRWSDANKEAFLKAVREGKGLVVYHFASSAFTKPNWEEFEKAVGGWRTQGFHGPRHNFTVKKTDAQHPISEGLPAKFDHAIDELYQNSMLPEGAQVLATAYSDPSKPKGTGKDEPVVWVNMYGKGRVYNNALGHDVEALSDVELHPWLRRGVVWAATGKAE